MACEGNKRVVRHLTSDQWRYLLYNFGFSSIPVFSDEESFEDTYFRKKKSDYGEIRGTDGHPISFVSAWTLTEGVKPSSFGIQEKDFGFISSDIDYFLNFPILQEDGIHSRNI